MLGKLDRDFLMLLNSIIGDDQLFNKTIDSLGEYPLLRGFPTFFALCMLWFSNDFEKRRARIFAGLLATCLAGFLSVWLQYHLSIHTRPLLDQTLSIKIFEPVPFERWGRLGSFPSDAGTFYFAFATIIFIEVPFVGAIALLWSLLTVGLIRVALGYHYPSDILGALLLGPGCVLLVSKSSHGAQCERFLALFGANERILHALFFIFIAEAYALFPSLQGILRGLVMIGKRMMVR